MLNMMPESHFTHKYAILSIYQPSGVQSRFTQRDVDTKEDRLSIEDLIYY